MNPLPKLSVLITGASGLLGSHVRGAIPFPYRDFVRRRIELPTKRFDVVIHCAAITDSTYCENHPQETQASNVDGTERLVEWAKQTGALFIFVSTDLVFDGNKGGYTESDIPSPLGIYGNSKWQAEQIVLNTMPNHASVVRTSLLLGKSPTGDRSVDEKLLHAWKSGIQTPLYIDEFRSPANSTSVADAIAKISEQRLVGVFHVAGSKRMSRYELGKMIAEKNGIPLSVIDPVEATKLELKPKRPKDVSLDCSKAYKFNLIDRP